MARCRTIAVLTLLAMPAAAQTPPIPPPPPKPPAAPAPSAPPQQALAPAPMPDPLMAPDLQPHTGHPPTLLSLVQQSTWQDAVTASARAQYKQIPGSCPAASLKPTENLTVYAPIQFDPNGALAAGIWSEKVTVSGCAVAPTLNILTIAQPGSPPVRIPTLPGDTHADPATQKSALQYAQAIAARATPPKCREEMFTDTKFDGYTGLPNPDVRDGRSNRAWREVWSLNACGVPYDIEMTFTPNGQGTELSATNPEKRH